MSNLNKTELQTLAADNGLDTTGTKAVLLARILAHEEAEAAKPAPLPTMHALRKARANYVTIVNGSKASVCCGDALAALLAPMTPLQVAELASGFAGENLAMRYAHLNPGQMRMNSGNRVRAMLKRGDTSIELVTAKAHELHLIADVAEAEAA